tara:strand:+ start:2691 stop:4805 length:2115 start_codon:yes stop_codon:yes gene_type:complete
MGLITIGGQSAYIIDSKPAETGRTSTGVGYAQLVSQQRWKIWEEAQKSVLRQMEFEKMGYEAQLDAYAKQKEQLTKSLARAQEMKTKVAQGSASYKDLISLAKADAAAESRGASTTKETEVVKPVITATGRIKGDAKSTYKTKTSKGKVQLPSERLAELGGATGIKSPKEIAAENEAAKEEAKKQAEEEWNRRFENRTDKSLDAAAWSKSEEGKEIEEALAAIIAEPASSFGEEARKQAEEEKDAQSKSSKYIQSLEDQIAQLEMPQIGFDTNVLSRTRETFGGMAGVGGLGFAPRRSKISPIYDEGRAKEAMAAQRPGAEEAIALAASKNADDLRASVLSGKDIKTKARIQELQAAKDVAGPGDVELAKLINAEIQKLSAPSVLTTEEEANIARTARSAALQDFRSTALETGPGERTAGQFMSKQPTEVAPRPDSSQRPNLSPTTKISDLDIFKNFVVPGVDSSGFQFGGQGPVEPVAQAAKPTVAKPAEQELIFGGGVMPATSEEPAPSGAFELDDNNNIDIGTLKANSSQDLYSFFAPETTDANGKKQLVTLTDAEKTKIWQSWTDNEQVTSKLNTEQAKEWYTNAISEIKSPTGKTKAKTRSESYASNLLKIIKTGKDLADKPSKLARIAKPDLSEKERSKVVPEHILLVDKLYNINKGRSGAFKSTYDEIERVYKTDEKKKKAALEYLAAKEILTSEMA